MKLWTSPQRSFLKFSVQCGDPNRLHFPNSSLRHVPPSGLVWRPRWLPMVIISSRKMSSMGKKIFANKPLCKNYAWRPIGWSWRSWKSVIDSGPHTVQDVVVMGLVLTRSMLTRFESIFCWVGGESDSKGPNLTRNQLRRAQRGSEQVEEFGKSPDWNQRPRTVVLPKWNKSLASLIAGQGPPHGDRFTPWTTLAAQQKAVICSEVRGLLM